LSVEDVNIIKITRKTMYQLMGEVLALPDKSIMFILLYMLAILIEVGIFICSPHFHKMENEEKASLDFTPLKKLKEGTYVSPNPPNNTPIGNNSIITNPAINSNSILPVHRTSNSHTNIPTTQKEFDLQQDTKRQVEYDRYKTAPSEIKEAVKVASELLSVQPEEKFIDASEVTEPEEEIPIRAVKSPIERFVDALFNNDGKTYLKDKYIAAEEAGIKKIEGMNIFNYMTRTKVNGYSMVEFRKETSQWHPNLTSEVIKHNLNNNYPSRKKE